MQKQLARILSLMFKDADWFDEDFVVKTSPSTSVCIKDDYVIIWKILVRYKDVLPFRENAWCPIGMTFDPYSANLPSEVCIHKYLSYHERTLKEVLQWILSQI